MKRDTTKPARIAPAKAATGCWRAKRLNDADQVLDAAAAQMRSRALEAVGGDVHVVGRLRNLLADLVGGAVDGAAKPIDALGALRLAGFGEVRGRVAERFGGALLDGPGGAGEKALVARALRLAAGSLPPLLCVQVMFHARLSH